MQANALLAQTHAPANWLVIVLLVAVAAALLFVSAAWVNRRWRK